MNIYSKTTVSSGYNILHNEGVAVKIAEKKKGLNFDVTFVPPGVHALIPLRAMRLEFMNKPPSYSCLTEFSEQYSESLCFDDCIFKAAWNRANAGIESIYISMSNLLDRSDKTYTIEIKIYILDIFLRKIKHFLCRKSTIEIKIYILDIFHRKIERSPSAPPANFTSA